MGAERNGSGDAGAVGAGTELIRCTRGGMRYGVFFSAAAGFAAGLAAGFGAQKSGSALIQSGLTSLCFGLMANNSEREESTVAAKSSWSFFIPSSPMASRNFLSSA